MVAVHAGFATSSNTLPSRRSWPYSSAWSHVYDRWVLKISVFHACCGNRLSASSEMIQSKHPCQPFSRPSCPICSSLNTCTIIGDVPWRRIKIAPCAKLGVSSAASTELEDFLRKENVRFAERVSNPSVRSAQKQHQASTSVFFTPQRYFMQDSTERQERSGVAEGQKSKAARPSW